MKPDTKYTLLTFYKFIDIKDPHKEVVEHKQFCKDIGMMGRIFIGEEGINATLSGNIGQIMAYKLYLKNNPLFDSIDDIDEKATHVDRHQFKKMIVRYRKEIVALGVKYPASKIEEHKYKISPKEFKDLLDSDKNDYVILDLRNDYEYKLGHFKGALPAGTLTFKETPEYLSKYKDLLDGKQVIMYCTGGIRCEKASVMLEEAGIRKPLQLDGGVVKYVNNFNDGNWLGSLYTFDERINTFVGDTSTHTIISECHYTGEPEENYHNCRYGPCNRQIIAKNKQFRKHMGFCSEQCAKNAYENLLIRDSDWDPLNYKELRGEIKKNPTQKDGITEKIRIHIKKWLAGVEFNHKNPVEDDEARLDLEELIET